MQGVSCLLNRYMKGWIYKAESGVPYLTEVCDCSCGIYCCLITNNGVYASLNEAQLRKHYYPGVDFKEDKN